MHPTSPAAPMLNWPHCVVMGPPDARRCCLAVGGQVVERASVERTGVRRFRVGAAPSGWLPFDTGGTQLCDDGGRVVRCWRAEAVGRVEDRASRSGRLFLLGSPP